MDPNDGDKQIRELFFEVETRKHQQEVAKLMMLFSANLLYRAQKHDQSKLEKPERDIFIEFTPKLKGCTYGSDEYKGFLKEMKIALDHHYMENSHHPEFYPKGVDDMSLFNIVEMLCDWIAATKRHADGDIQKSIEKNEERFGIAPQLSNIFRRTVEAMKTSELEDRPKSGPAQANPNLGVGPCSASGVDLNPVAGKHRMGEPC